MGKQKQLHQINFKDNQYYVGEIQLTTVKSITDAIKQKQQVMRVFINGRKCVQREKLNIIKARPHKAAK